MNIRVSNLDVTEPIDFITPVQKFGVRQSLFIKMLNDFEDLSLTIYMGQVAQGLNDSDWTKMKEGAHTLKGSSAYVGAGRLHYACYHI